MHLNVSFGRKHGKFIASNPIGQKQWKICFVTELCSTVKPRGSPIDIVIVFPAFALWETSSFIIKMLESIFFLEDM